MKKTWLFLLALPLLLAARETDVLAVIQGRAEPKDGAKGDWSMAGGRLKMTKSPGPGYLIFAGPSRFDPPIRPGRMYEAAAELELKGSAVGRLMISMPGGKRRPFPACDLKSSGRAAIVFTAKPDEKQVHFHAVLRGAGEMIVKSMTLKEISPDEYNHLLSIGGVAKMHENAVGKCVTSGGVVTITKSNEPGYILYAGPARADLPIEPGASYEVTSDMEIRGEATGALMLAMPGGKRRPFPIKKLNRSGTAALRFTANADETRLRLHLVVRGQGEVVFRNIHVRRLPPGDPTKRSYRGAELRQHWSVENAPSEVRSPDGLAGICTNATRIVSPPLAWNAAEVAAVELDAAFGPDGGPAVIFFRGEENGRAFTGSLRRTAIPSGEKRTVTFFFARQPAWRGRITQVAFGFDVHSQSEFRVTGVRALSEPNLIPDAAVPGEKPVELIHPGAAYTLSRRDGGGSAVTLTMRDADGADVAAVRLEPGMREVKFTAPLTTVTAVAVYGPGAGRPVLVCDKVPFFGIVPEVRWQTPWIWVGVRDEPQGKVRFTREFTLPAAVKRAEIRYTADDACAVDLNGHRFRKEIANLHRTERRDVTAMLRSGENRIAVDVVNDSGAGGLLLELYAELENGDVFTLGGDRRWRYSYEDKTGFAVERGVPPDGVWGDKVDCVYIGPRVAAEVREFTPSGLAIRPAAAVPDFGELTVEIVSDSGEIRRLKAAIEPRSGQWKPGAWNSVVLRFNADLAAGMKGVKFRLGIVPEFLAFAEPPVCSLPPRRIERAEFPAVKLIGAGSRPYFEVDGRALAPFYFDLPFSFIDMPLQKAHFVANAARAGSNIVRSWYGLRDFWKAPDRFDFSSLDFALAVIRSHMPDAHVIITCKTYMPDWWLEANPGDRIVWFRENRRYRNYYQTLGSLKWKQDAQIGIRALIEHLRASGNAKFVIGIVFADGDTCEWLWGSHPYGGRHHFIQQGDSAADREAFGQFLAARRGGAAGPREIPRPDRWDARDEGIFLDPEKSRDVSDYWEFRSQACSDGIRAFTRLVKEETGRRLLSGAYYGYHVQLSRVYRLFQGSGHLRLHEVAGSGDCDLYFAPTQYGLRVPGESDGTMQPAAAITLHGGLPVMEFDYRTYTEYMPGQLHNGAADTPEMTLSLLDKGFGVALTRATGGHWMELHERWFREPLQYNHVGKLLKLYRSLPKTVAGTVTPDVCLVNSENSPLRTANNVGDGVYRAVIYETCRIMPRTGAAYRHVLLSDLLTPGKVPAHRFYVFLDLFELSDAQRAALKRRLTAENAHALWLYAPGVLKPGSKVDPAGITEMTGVPVERIDAPWSVNWESAPEFGGRTRPAFLTTPLNFRPTGGDVIAARSGRHIAVAGRRDSGRTDYFSAALVPEEHALQEMFRRAGVRLYQHGTDVLHAGNDFIVLHAVTGGRKVLRLPPGCAAVQILGPRIKFTPDAPAWTARPGVTYGFIISRKGK